MFKNILYLITGLYIMAFGVAMSISANLGISPIACIPFILFMGTHHFSVGFYTTLLNCIYILIQFLIIGKSFNKSEWLQLLIAFVFGYFTDFNIYLFNLFSLPEIYLFKITLTILSCFIVGVGIFFILQANLLTLPVIGIVKVFAIKFNKNYGHLKILSDIIFVIIGLILSIILCHSIVGIREGTIISAYLTGFSMKIISKSNHFHAKK
jgi:uncharacterized membrane protein YczE